MMSDQQVIIEEIFDMSHEAFSLLGDLKVLSEETKKELEGHIVAIGSILAPIVGNVEHLDSEGG